MTRPRLLDLFSGAGGAARGYQQAGFHVTGVDLAPQPNYIGDAFHQADALTFPLDGFDAIHASPPCQHYANVTRWTGAQANHAALIAPMRARLIEAGVPWVIENVRTAELDAWLMLCGTQFGLPIRRHRYFQTSWMPYALAEGCRHRADDFSFDHGGKQPESTYRDAMGVEWMTVQESREAIPPAYTRWIGSRLLAELNREAA